MWGRGVPILTVAVLSCRLGITSLSERRPARMAGRDVRAEDSSVLANLWQAGYLGTHFSLLPSIESPVCAGSEEHASSSGGWGGGDTPSCLGVQEDCCQGALLLAMPRRDPGTGKKRVPGLAVRA